MHDVAPVCETCSEAYRASGSKIPAHYKAGCDCFPLAPVCPRCRVRVYHATPDLASWEFKNGQRLRKMMPVRDERGRPVFLEDQEAHACGREADE